MGGGNFEVLAPTHTYTARGTYQMTVTVTDTDPASTIGGSSVFVASAPLVPVTPIPFTPTEGTLLNQQVVAQFTDPDMSDTVGSFTAIIDWGDGSPNSVGTITEGTGVAFGTFSVAGNHIYVEAGTYKTTATITGNGLTPLTIANTAHVSDAALTLGPALTIGAAKGQLLSNQVVATFTDANPYATAGSFTATINWGDSTTSTGVVTLIGGTGAGAVFSISGSHTYLAAGTDNIEVSVTDVGGATIPLSLSATVTVANTPLWLTVSPLSATVGVATPVNQVIATFVDEAAVDPIGDYSATINWGDGSAVVTTGITIVALGGGNFQIEAPSHTYTARGTHQVTVTVNDTDPASSVGSNVAFVASAPLPRVVQTPSRRPREPAHPAARGDLHRS